MPTPPDNSTPTTPDASPEAGRDASPAEAAVAATDPAAGAVAGAAAGPGVLDDMQHQVAVFARRAEQTRLGGVGSARNSMDRAAYLLLNRLHEEGAMGVKALAAGMGIDSSTVTRQVAPLVDSGLVLRTSHPEDGRAVVLDLSPRGRARLQDVRSSRRELMALLTGDWPAADRAAFTALLSRFNGALSDYHAPPPGGSASAPEVSSS